MDTRPSKFGAVDAKARFSELLAGGLALATGDRELATAAESVGVGVIGKSRRQ